jgi:hypothetical protein
MKTKESVQQTSANDRAAFEATLKGLYELVGENTPTTGLNYRTVARDILNMPDTKLSRTLIDMERAGTLIRSYKRADAQKGGKLSTWVLPYPQAEALAKQRAYWEAHPPMTTHKRLKSQATAEAVTPEAPVTVTESPTEETRAIAGPEASSPFEVLRSERKDESAALIEAARQYVGRRDVIRRAFQEMEKQGITVDWSHVDQVVSVETDDRLETVADLLPYVTQLEKRIERLTTDNTELRERNKGIDVLGRENRALREQNQRILAERVGRAQTAAHV